MDQAGPAGVLAGRFVHLRAMDIRRQSQRPLNLLQAPRPCRVLPADQPREVWDRDLTDRVGQVEHLQKESHVPRYPAAAARRVRHQQ